jgi:hypothetical protein
LGEADHIFQIAENTGIGGDAVQKTGVLIVDNTTQQFPVAGSISVGAISPEGR